MKICKLIAGSSLTITIQPFKLTTKMEFEDLKVEVPLDEEIVSDLKDVPVRSLIFTYFCKIICSSGIY